MTLACGSSATAAQRAPAIVNHMARSSGLKPSSQPGSQRTLRPGRWPRVSPSMTPRGSPVGSQGPIRPARTRQGTMAIEPSVVPRWIARRATSGPVLRCAARRGFRRATLERLSLGCRVHKHGKRLPIKEHDGLIPSICSGTAREPAARSGPPCVGGPHAHRDRDIRISVGGREATPWSPWGAFRSGAEDHGRGDDAADDAEGQSAMERRRLPSQPARSTRRGGRGRPPPLSARAAFHG